ncbi:MAG: PIN domain-containing protein [Pseudomonadales bacterium]|nr:PIN domain-containing protein [Pseudomonadales bacterium]
MSGVIIDTCMWSLAFRRKGVTETRAAKEIGNLIDENRAKIIGLIRQEVLSGYSDTQSYIKLRDKLRYFPNELTIDTDYEIAAEYSNLCRKNGIQGSHADFLICAVSARLKMKIYTNDKDFQHYSKYLPVNLHEEN